MLNYMYIQEYVGIRIISSLNYIIWKKFFWLQPTFEGHSCTTY